MPSKNKSHPHNWSWSWSWSRSRSRSRLTWTRKYGSILQNCSHSWMPSSSLSNALSSLQLPNPDIFPSPFLINRPSAGPPISKVRRSGKLGVVSSRPSIPVYWKPIKRELVGVYMYKCQKLRGSERSARLNCEPEIFIQKVHKERHRTRETVTVTPPSNAHVRV